jgi:multisubunit Na+/H+ antiporter MnhB subunit
VLATGLVLVAWRSIFAETLFKCVVLFIAFGLLMSLAWVRLDAPDIALAEAAIGAGITGALMLDALGHVAGEPAEATRRSAESETRAPSGARSLSGAVLLAGTGALVALVVLGLWQLPAEQPGLASQALAAVAEHPVSNAATVVLLDLRAYDTFLEMAVLLVAALGALILKARALREPRAVPPAHGSEVLQVLARWLAPLMVLVAGYLLWAGTAQSGGAFPAGAMLGAAGVLLFLAHLGRDFIADTRSVRMLLSVGTASFLVAGLVGLVSGRAFLEHAAGSAYGAIIAIEAAVTLSIGVTLALIYGASALEPRQTEDGVSEREATE